MKQFGFSISTGVEAMISTRTEKWEHLPHPYVTNCSHGQLRYSTLTYSYSACCLEKMTDFVSEKCGCKEIHMPGPYRECNLQESLTCTSPLIDTFGHQNTEFCNVACEEVNYIPHISYANIPSKPLVDDLWDKKNMSRDFLRDNYADVSVFLEDLNCKQITFVPAITLNSIWSNFGGLMGLCLGASLITIVECIDFILFCCCKHR
ncbi:acid-sensing ion channel 5-like [Ptychodera flava]|uniref:acid-sensing ion channel 5-like n=1 Tax=Ptychodera flava TaxID=63121 RepID=UPI00396A3F04